MGIEVIWALGLFGVLLVTISLKGMRKYFMKNNLNMHITFDKNVF